LRPAYVSALHSGLWWGAASFEASSSWRELLRGGLVEPPCRPPYCGCPLAGTLVL
jgi:hypothetical protein